MCNGQRTVLRHCGHETQLPCKQLLAMVRAKKLPKCKELVPRRLGECGHEVMVACSTKNDPEPECHQVVSTPFVFGCGKHKVQPGTCHKLRRLQLETPPCKEKVQCALYRCSHMATVACRLEQAVTASQPGKRLEPSAPSVVVANVDYCVPCADAPPCEVEVAFRDACGHNSAAACHLAFRWAAEPGEAPPCETVVQLDSALCGHALERQCHEAEALRTLELWGDAAPWRPSVTHSLDGGATAVEVIVVEHNTPRPQLDTLSVAERALLTCGAQSMVQRKCGHTEMVPCIDALKSLDTGRCSSSVGLTLPCGHEATLLCHRAELIARGAVVHWCGEKVVKTCGVCGVSDCTVACSQQDVACRSEVVAPLPCRHEVRWVCGEDADPRTDRTKACAECVLKQWKAASLGAAPADLLVQMLQWVHRPHLQWVYRLHAFAASKIPDALEVRALPLSEQRLRGLAAAQQNILAIGCDLLQIQIDNSDLWAAEKAAPPLLSDVSCFDIVFCLLTEPASDEERINQLYGQRDTLYGLGTTALLLTLDNLKACKPPTNLAMRICVGAAFRFSALDNVKPFRRMAPGAATQRGGNRKRDRKKQAPTAQGEQAAKANTMRHQQLVQGADYVIPLQPGEPLAAQQPVYWIQGAVVPLCVAKLQLFHACGVCGARFAYTDGGPATGLDFVCFGCRHECCICFEAHGVDRGHACDSGHFLCDECLDGHVRYASSFDALEAFRRNEGVKCPVQASQYPIQ